MPSKEEWLQCTVAQMIKSVTTMVTMTAVVVMAVIGILSMADNDKALHERPRLLLVGCKWHSFHNIGHSSQPLNHSSGSLIFVQAGWHFRENQT